MPTRWLQGKKGKDERVEYSTQWTVQLAGDLKGEGIREAGIVTRYVSKSHTIRSWFSSCKSFFVIFGTRGSWGHRRAAYMYPNNMKFSSICPTMKQKKREHCASYNQRSRTVHSQSCTSFGALLIGFSSEISSQVCRAN